MYVKITIFTEECLWLLMRVCIQFNSHVFKSADQTTFIFHMDMVLLFWIFDDILQWCTCNLK